VKSLRPSRPPGNPGRPEHAHSAATNGQPGADHVRQIVQALSLLIRPDQRFEIRAFYPGRSGSVSRLFTADKIALAAKYADDLSRSGKYQGVYYTLNAVKTGPIKGSAAADVDIVRRVLLLIDTDPERPADTSSTDSEKTLAIEQSGRIRDFLRERGWPDPIRIDSGNGGHLVYAIDLPSDDASRDLVKALLEGLARRFNTPEVKVDVVVSNASRVSKLPATMTRKGEDTADRPHRRAGIIEAPAERVTVPAEMLDALVAELAPAESGQPELDLGAEIERKQATVAGPAADIEARAIAYLAKCEPAVSGQRGHDKAFKAAVSIGPGFDLPADVAYRMLWEHYNPRCDPPWSEKELKHKVDDAYEKETRRGWLRDAPPKKARRNGEATHSKIELNGDGGGNGTPPEPPSATDPGSPAMPRADIRITADLHEAIDSAAAAAVGHPEVYEWGGSLVVQRKEKDDPEDAPGVKRAAGAPLIVALNKVTVRTVISRRARFWGFDKRDREWVRKPPPRDVAEAVLGLGRFPGSRELCGIVEAPTLRPDGSLLDTPGYDRRTGLLYVPNAEYPPISADPTIADAARAAGELLYLVSDFPFKADADRAAWLALVLTLVARGAIEGPVPGFLFSANVAGSGKTRLVVLASRIAAGRPPAFDGYSLDDDEMEKRLSAVTMTGDPFLLLDNAPNGSAVGCPSLDRAIMADGVFRTRILGKSEMTPLLLWRTVIAITGNNMGTKDDALRRFMLCSLLSPMERPETRDPEAYEITKDTGLTLDEYVMRERPRLVAAALTILRGYIVAGRPKGITEDGKKLVAMDFPRWEDLVRQAVFHATGVDPCGSRESLQANDETTLDRHRVVSAWKDLCLMLNKPGGITAREAVEVINGSITAERYRDAREAFARALRPGTALVDSGKLGCILRRHRNAVTPYGILKENGISHQAVIWTVATD
jgi:hypothetical protein